jgi:hypothetical protein
MLVFAHDFAGAPKVLLPLNARFPSLSILSLKAVRLECDLSFSWPKSALTSRPRGLAAPLNLTNAVTAWTEIIARTISSLPIPISLRSKWSRRSGQRHDLFQRVALKILCDCMSTAKQASVSISVTLEGRAEIPGEQRFAFPGRGLAPLNILSVLRNGARS